MMIIKEDIVLFYPKPTPDAQNYFPLPLLALARMVNQDKYNVVIINATTDESYLEKAVKYSREALCFGVSTIAGYQIIDALKVSQAVKKNNPLLPIIWGGYWPTSAPKETLSNPYVDIVVKGQGEIAFKELLFHIEEGKSLEGVSGIFYKTKNGKIVETPNRTLQDINRFPSLPYNLVDANRCIRYHFLWGRSLDYYTSQGCPYDCKFCAEPIFSGRKWTGLTPERVVKDVEYLVNSYQIDSIRLVDPEVFINKKRILGICKKIIEKNIKVNFMTVDTRVDTLMSYSDEEWKLMERAGIHEFSIGIESGSNQALKAIGKNIAVDDIIALFERMRNYNFKSYLSIMVGIPTIDIKKEFLATWKLVDMILKKYRSLISTMSVVNYTPYPGTELYNQAIKEGFIPPKNLVNWGYVDHYSLYPCPWRSMKYQKFVNYIDLYILPYFFEPTSQKTIFHRTFYGILKNIYRIRWKYRWFNLFFEKRLLDSINKRYLKRIAKSKKM
ncbi:MAG: B12-binding domain-containing radical SAM protein [bacterium]